MTIDEAIAHARETSAKKRKQADNYRTYSLQDGHVWNDNIEGCEDCAKEHEQLAEWLTQLKEYQQLEKQGRLIKLPCKVGDTVYGINTDRNIVSALKIISMNIYSYAIYFNYQLIDGIYKNIVNFADTDIGKTVFLTESEVEAKLKELRGDSKEHLSIMDKDQTLIHKFIMEGKQTNADRIRNMSDEELAEFIVGLNNHCLAGIGECDCSNESTVTCEEICNRKTLDWLQSEAE